MPTGPGLAIMAQNDCLFLPSQEFASRFGYSAGGMSALDAVHYFGFLISYIVGQLILLHKGNRSMYPLNYIGYICIFQAANMQNEFYFVANFCDLKEPSMIQNMLLSNPEVFGKYTLFEVDRMTLVGAVMLLNTSLYALYVLIEILFTVSLNVDMVYTITQPFKRNAVLNQLNIFLKVGSVIAILLVMTAAIRTIQFSEGVTYSMTNLDNYGEMLDHGASIRFTFHKYRNPFFIPIVMLSGAVSFWSLMTIAMYRKTARKDTNIAVRRSLVRKQVVFYVLLNIFNFALILNTITYESESFELMEDSKVIEKLNGIGLLVF